MKLVKEIKSKDGILHFKRWEILKTKWFNIYIHGIYKADEDLHLHNHPWDYKSFVLYGTFVEKERTTDLDKDVKYRYNHLHFGSFIKRKANTFHKILRLESEAVYTLFITNKSYNKWGYDVDNKFVDFETYRKNKNNGNNN